MKKNRFCINQISYKATKCTTLRQKWLVNSTI